MAAVAAATLVRIALQPFLGSSTQFVTFFVAVVVAGATGGRGPALLATGLSCLVVDFLFVEPYGSFAVGRIADVVALGCFALAATSIALIAGQLHAARDAAYRALAERREAEEALRRNEERLGLAQQVAQIGTFEWNVKTGTNVWTPELEQLYGLSPGTFPGTQPAWEALVHPDDRAHAVECVAQALAGGPFDAEWRVCLPDGGVRWLHGRARVLRDAAGSPERLLGVNIDITDRKRAEAAIAAMGHRLESIVGAAGDGICGLDAADRVVLVNPALASMLGWSPADAVGRNAHELFHRSGSGGHPLFEACPIADAVRTGTARKGSDVFWRADGATVPVEYTYAPIGDGGDDLAGVLLVRDVSERMHAERALLDAKVSAERAKAVAEEATRAKDHFLAVLSHELRTPLTPVVAILDLMGQRSWDAEIRHQLDVMRRNVELEARLIDDLLDLTRITRGKVELDRRHVDLGTIVDRAVEVCRPDIDARHVHFGVDRGPGSYVVDADPARLQQVFWNLLKNAVKFTPHHGCIGIRCRPVGDSVAVEVNDSGIGIEPDALEHVFDAFRQAERSITRQFGGLGLGLTICKALVELHGGTITAHSEGRGRGTTVRVTLPLAAAAVDQPDATRLGRRTSAGVRVLLVEDHGDTAAVMQCALAAQGHDVAMARDVATALEMAEREVFDVLVSDLGLPDASGHDLVRALRARGQTLPAIALSGYGQEDDLRRSLDAGFAVHLVKPARPRVLADAVARVVGERR